MGHGHSGVMGVPRVRVGQEAGCRGDGLGCGGGTGTGPSGGGCTCADIWGLVIRPIPTLP